MDINQTLEKFGTKGIILGLIITLIGTIVKTKWFGEFWTKITNNILDRLIKKEEPHTQEITKSDLINHDLFTYIDFWLNSKIPTFQFSTEYRTFVFRKYLKLYLESYKEEILEFVKSENFKDMDASKLKKNLFDTLNNVVLNYEKKASEAGVPNIVIIKMKTRNNDTIDLTLDLISSVSDSPFYESPNNYLKIYSILNIVLSILENTLSNSQSTCNSINGELKNQKFVDVETGKVYIEP